MMENFSMVDTIVKAVLCAFAILGLSWVLAAVLFSVTKNFLGMV